MISISSSLLGFDSLTLSYKMEVSRAKFLGTHANMLRSFRKLKVIHIVITTLLPNSKTALN
jgi:hypothetical protein